MAWYNPLSWFPPKKTPQPGEIWEIRPFDFPPVLVVEVLSVDPDCVQYKIISECREREAWEDIRRFRAHYTQVKADTDSTP